MYLVEEDGHSVMRICDCPAGLRRKEYLRGENSQEPEAEDQEEEGGQA
jgi:hypothetical protein